MGSRLIKISLFVLAAFLLCANVCFAQGLSAEGMRSALTKHRGFTVADYALIDDGQIVLKRFPATDKREIAVSGLIRIDLPFDVVMGAFQRTMAQQNKNHVDEHGSFSRPPKAEDFDRLTIDVSEIEDLRDCRPGKCKWNLSADMIRRVNTEIDWNATDYQKKATEFIKKLLVEYVAEYVKNGDPSLVEYNDSRNSVSLRNEYDSLEESLFWLDEFLPELGTYLSDYPAGQLSGIENRFGWTKVKIGLKPVVLFTHTLDYQKVENGVSQEILIAKQFYANHYFDSSLGFTAITGFKDKDGKPETYLLMINRSRARAFSGNLRKLVMAIVNDQAQSRLEEVLEDTKRFSALAIANREAANQPVEKGSDAMGILKRATVFWVFLLGLMLAVVLFLVWKTRSRDAD